MTLRLGTDIDSIAVTKTIENLATSIYAYGADDAGGNPITLAGYSYDDGTLSWRLRHLMTGTGTGHRIPGIASSPETPWRSGGGW